jgi:dTDP-4-dehydrorhamnose 3,5-epimerase
VSDIQFEKELRVEGTGIEGLKVVELSVHGDARGWFKENWQRAKMCALGVPDLRVVQNNVSFNAERGVTRGIHAEPWDKFVSVATGSVFGAWVDLRQGSPTYGRVFTCTLDPSRAIYVPRGVGNSFQALEDGTAYTYLVDAHWSAGLRGTYTFVSLADPALGIDWPIPLPEATLSEADRHHPMLADVTPMAPKRTLVTGCDGQLGRAVKALAEGRGIASTFDFRDIDEFDLSDPAAYGSIDWGLYGTVVNCGAYTAVDRAETPEGRVAAWAANATGPALLARTCAEHGMTLVHVSSDYVFDGTREVHDEGEPSQPLSVYGQSKAAGDLAVAGCPRHYVLRSSWVIGDGRNFVRHHGGAQRQASRTRMTGWTRSPVGRRPAGPPHLHARHGRRDPPPAGQPRPLRHLRLHGLRRGALLGGRGEGVLRGRQRQRGRRPSRLHRGVLRLRQGPHRPPSCALHARPLEAGGHGLLHARLGAGACGVHGLSARPAIAVAFYCLTAGSGHSNKRNI